MLRKQPLDASRNVRLTATGILAGLTATFAATFLFDVPPGWVVLVRAMAEAGMVGGLADWFAVEALFRRPLGLPIPHTALLPNNQKRAAENIAQFIDVHFLEPDRLIAEIKKTDPIRQMALWLSRPANAALIGNEFIWAIRKLAQVQTKSGIPDHLHVMLLKVLRKVLRAWTGAWQPFCLAGFCRCLTNCPTRTRTTGARWRLRFPTSSRRCAGTANLPAQSTMA